MTDYYNSQNNQGSGGGGFVGGGSPFGSDNGSPSGRQRTEASHSLRPVSIAQLNKATQAHPDAEWHIDGQEVGQVTLVAQVVSVNQQATNCVYWLDDGSGRFESRHWIDSSSEEDAGKWEGVDENDYVRVTGSLKAFNNKRYINASMIHKSTDVHEPYFHNLDIIATMLMLERGAPVGGGLSAQPAGASMNGGGHAGPDSAPSAYGAQSASSVNNSSWSHLPALSQQILNFLASEPPSDEGVHVAAIARAVKGDAHLISEALDGLSDEGYVFSTIDQSHFNISI